MNSLPSKVLEEAVNEIAKLPGVGRRSALRMALHLLKQHDAEVEKFGNAILKLKREIKYCSSCNNFSEAELCSICSNHRRDASLVCVVEDVRDLIAIENTSQYHGLYHVLGGIISPMDGIGPSDLSIEPLLRKISEGKIRELIMALSGTMEGDTTVFYLFKKTSALQRADLKFTTIARGVSVGDDLEYADEVTLGRSILHRTTYENSLVR